MSKVLFDSIICMLMMLCFANDVASAIKALWVSFVCMFDGV